MCLQEFDQGKPGSKLFGAGFLYAHACVFIRHPFWCSAPKPDFGAEKNNQPLAALISTDLLVVFHGLKLCNDLAGTCPISHSEQNYQSGVGMASTHFTLRIP